MLESYNHQIETDYGRNLPVFENEELAKVYYYEQRKENLSLLEDIYAELGLTLNYSVKSLIQLEEVYFSFFQENKFRDFQLSIGDLEECMSIYFGEVVTIHSDEASWLVKEYSFTEGAYVMGLQSGRSATYFSNLFENHYMTAKDASEQKIYKLYKRYEKKGKK
ncbi:hypothetical protein M4D55_16945 [Metabacillus idriensis]|uniref:hypothetical protein n=1 Tax=Metabacillus idriensis TaxID=324768 RepID=UPI00203EA946|nr:hypothetical protein [Metabacillus idriensis]MCM3597460.1 hypothetical protein [Metabacillus idriensis]